MADLSPIHPTPSPDEKPPPSSIDFGTLETLTLIRSLTDVGAMTRLLHECITYQHNLDLCLECILDFAALFDADLILDSIRSTANLADQVSRKVRQLDLAKSRVDSDDYESASRFVVTFVLIDALFSGDFGSEQREQLIECKRRVESALRDQLAASVDKRDHQMILRFIPVFPLLGLQQEGLLIYVSYIRKVIALRSRLEFEHLVEIVEQGSSNLGHGGANFVTCLTNLFKDIVLAVEENDPVLRSLCGEDAIVYAIFEIQEECDSRGTQILKRYMDYRKLSRLASKINTYSNSDVIEEIELNQNMRFLIRSSTTSPITQNILSLGK